MIVVSNLNRCVFCAYGLTDDLGSRCGARGALEDPMTIIRVLREIKEECGNAEERYERRMHVVPLRPDMTAAA